MAKSRRDEILEKTSTVSSIPAAALQVMKVLQDPNANMGEIVQVISYDPGLTSNILKLANSSYFGCAKAISSLREAVVRLGSANIFKMVTASIANVALNRGIRGYNLAPGELWEHSIAIAVASETFADMRKMKNVKLSFTSGLLHDIGKVVLGRFIDRSTFEEIAPYLNSGRSYLEAESEILGIDHAEVGALLLHQWNIPDVLAMTVRWHHQPENMPEDLTPAIVNTCDFICMEANIGNRPEAFKPKPREDIFQSLELTPEIKEELVLRTQSSVENIKDVFSKRD